MFFIPQLKSYNHFIKPYILQVAESRNGLIFQHILFSIILNASSQFLNVADTRVSLYKRYRVCI